MLDPKRGRATAAPPVQFGAMGTGTSAGGNGGSPRMTAAAFSARMIVGAFGLPLTMPGTIEGAARRPSTPVDLRLGVDHVERLWGGERARPLGRLRLETMFAAPMPEGGSRRRRGISRKMVASAPGLTPGTAKFRGKA